MSARIYTGLVALALVLPPAASAGWFHRRPPTVVAYYYAPVIVAAYQAYSVPLAATYCVPTTSRPPSVRLYATPTAAPPSVTLERQSAAPTANEPPKVRESRSDGVKETGEPPTASTSGATTRTSSYRAEKASADLCRVGFLNLSPRDLVVTVEGVSRVLARGDQHTLTLNRQFVWRIAGSDEEIERVPAGKRSVDIVIRR